MKWSAIIALIFAAASAQAGDGAQKFVTSSDCRGWFESWAANTKVAIAGESKAAQGLKLDGRSLAEINLPIDAVLNDARVLCARLDSQKVKPANPAVATSPVQICTDAFKKWEDEMDNAYAMAVFERKISDENKDFIPAQDLARREAKLGRIFCQVLARLH